jgi:SAM-dependent methyltransferase
MNSMIERELNHAAEWPLEDLELLGRCPNCETPERQLIFRGLTDKAFRAAPGYWDLYACEACQTTYLDPRPDEASIGRAYSRYYTHAGEPEKSFFWHGARWVDRVKIAYLNSAYGYSFAGALPFGSLVVRTRPKLRSSIDYLIRHLRAPSNSAERLLDVGCGGGDFLAVAQALGYEAVGIDLDPKVVEAGQRAGLDVREAALDDCDVESSQFNHITMSHVLEHLHWPLAALRRCFHLLNRGGRIWISLPNLQASGLTRYGENWRGLEAPRHLTLYDFGSLRALLTKAGFDDVRILASDEPALFYFQQSEAMAVGQDPYAPTQVTSGLHRAANEANRRARRFPQFGESITVTARRLR